ncbi:MerR family transcriptional regulator [Niallia endozanthoxylica]|uniref:MerR family transcriptional regulator n=1 Tax=Niallia endozanthoxylica TaxID=2036016 RepID=A0A5J5HMX6_9BACI|nr:MerR family transcriptional regulator [Niallia endozanthoxylica]KAA9021557.1 MerR family transcriptional regulator [Niallia endozanthoxylica]
MYWKISNFVEEIKQTLQEEKLHINTVTGWFKKLEEEEIHYISRTAETDEKVYDELDLQIAVFIKKKRNQKWSLSAIFNEIKSEFELRSFPVEDEETTNVAHIKDIDFLNSKHLKELKGAFEEVAASQLGEMKSQYEEILSKLPNPRSKEEEREERFKEMIARRRVEYQLEKEALIMWSTKPEEERLKKVGLFRKEENHEERNRFIKDHIDKNFEVRLRNELGL